MRRDDWRIRVHARTVLTADAENFYLHARLDAQEGDSPVFTREWNERIERDLV
jgi:hypothetical protein